MTIGDYKTGISSGCDPTITRKQFIDKIVKRAALAGGLVVGCKVVDKFLVPPVYAQGSTGNGCSPTNSPVTDTFCGFGNSNP